MFAHSRSRPRVVSFIVACALTLCVTSSLYAQNVTLAWSANTESNIAGYMVLYGTQSGAQSGLYPNLVTVGNVTTTQVGPLAGGTTYYFVVKAFNTSGLVSVASDEVSFTMPSVAPTITSISPTGGPLTGGTTVAITGNNFVSGATVRFGAAAAAYVVVANANSITATTPAGPVGPLSVTVTNPGGLFATLSNGFTYSADSDVPPTLSAVSPSTGPSTGGTTITLSGANFVTGATVRVGGVLCTGVTFVSTSLLTAIAPAGVAGAQSVQVQNPDGRNFTLPSAFTYTSGTTGTTLNITGVTPVQGPLAGGTSVTVTGASFTPATTVSIGGLPARAITVVDSSTITALAPPGLAPGAFNVTVSDASAGALTLHNGFSYFAQPTAVDSDGDGMPDWWEIQFGLDPHDPTGDNGAAGDPDHDGVANIDEYRQGTHPRGFYKRYFAEGASNQFFSTRFAIGNVNTATAHTLLTFLDLAGQTSTQVMVLPPRTRATLNASSVTALNGTSFSTVVESDVVVVADRLMMWDPTGYGSSAETSVSSPSTTWYFAEGATTGAFDLYYLLQNPNATPADVTVRYLLPAGQAPIVLNYTVAPRSRFNIKVNDQPGLHATDVSSQITSDVPIIAERAMYFSTPQQAYAGGHASAGATELANQWFLAEGATGYFSMYILIGNPSDQQAQIHATFLLTDGSTIDKDYVVGPNTRFTIDVGGQDSRLRSASMSTLLTSTNNVPVIVERSMYWPNDGTGWIEGHNAVGLTETGTAWMLAEGEQGGPFNQATFVLVANTSSFSGDIKVTLFFEDAPEVSRTFTLLPNSRFNVPLDGAFAVAQGKRFATLVEAVGDNPPQIVVERAMYSDSQGVMWAAGASAVATKLR